MKTHDFRRCHPKTAGKKSVGEKYSVQKAPSQNCSWKTCGSSSEGAIPKLQVKNPEIKYHPKTADENSCVSKVPSQNWRPNTEPHQCHWLPATGFRRFKIQIPINFTMRPSHVPGNKQPNSPKTHKWSMWFCCSCFNVQTHNFGTWTLRAYSTDESLYQNRCQKINLQAKHRQPRLPATPFQTVQNRNLRKLHNASKSCSRQKNIYKKHGLEIGPYDDEWENSQKWTAWMEARWMGFSFGLNIHHSWYLPWHQKQALFWTWKRASDPRLPTVCQCCAHLSASVKAKVLLAMPFVFQELLSIV